METNGGIYVCKCCSRPMTEEEISNAKGGLFRCPACGIVQTLPQKDASPAVLSFLRTGEHERDVCRFDDAFEAYKKAAELAPEEPEAYFGMALSKFKVQFLRDYRDGKTRMQPICYEISDESISGDKNFRTAISLAAEEQKAEYLRQGEEIDAIKKEFFELKKSDLDYDCFLCVKVSEEGGGTTQDSHEALKLYHRLKERGFRPFYSEEETGGRTGSDYEALILYALYTSECMLIVCTDEDYLQMSWMKNEYMRFSRMLSDEKKERDSVTFAFRGKPIERLPGRNGPVQGIDLTKPDAYERITEFVRAHTPEARKKREELEAQKRREEEERKKKLDELEEELKKLREERANASSLSAAELLATLRRAEEEEKRQKEEEAKRAEEEKRRAALKDFEIEGSVLKRYIGNVSAVRIPDCITKIAGGAFQNNKTVRVVGILGTVQEIDDFAFRRCKLLTAVSLPESVTKIGDGVFYGCESLSEIEIPNSVLHLGKGAFCGCFELKSLTIPDSVTEIGPGAFGLCEKLTEITVSRGNRNYSSKNGVLFNKDKTVLVQAPGGISGKYVVPKGVFEIGKIAFFYCAGLTSVTIPNSVAKIGERAFDGCKNLTSVTIPKRFAENLDEIFGSEKGRIRFTFTK